MFVLLFICPVCHFVDSDIVRRCLIALCRVLALLHAVVFYSFISLSSALYLSRALLGCSLFGLVPLSLLLVPPSTHSCLESLLVALFLAVFLCLNLRFLVPELPPSLFFSCNLLVLSDSSFFLSFSSSSPRLS